MKMAQTDVFLYGNTLYSNRNAINRVFCWWIPQKMLWLLRWLAPVLVLTENYRVVKQIHDPSILEYSCNLFTTWRFT